MKSRKKLIIIGAGAGGLYAALLLSQQYDITILEARAEAGGRISTWTGGTFTDYIETGAEFIHGDLPISLALAKKAGLKVVKIEGKMYEVNKGKWSTNHEFFEYWDKILEKMSELKQDCTLDQFLQAHFNEDKYDEARRHVKRYAAGFDLADPSDASTMALYKEWSAEDENNYHIEGGYFRLIDYLKTEIEKAGVSILFNNPVSNIDWKERDVIVRTAAGETFESDKVLVTIPGHLINAAAENPLVIQSFPSTYQEAIEEIGYGNVIKFVLEFKTRLWKKDALFMFSKAAIPTWWSQLPNDRALLTGWLGGPPAAAFAGYTPAELVELALTSLSTMLDKTVNELREQLIDGRAYNWLHHPFAGGAYSYAKINSVGATSLLQQPVQNTIYLAGEYLNRGDHPGTVEAAFESAVTIAKILSADD